MTKHTVRELATDRNLWEEYIDPGNMAPDMFDAMTTDEKMDAIVEMFPGDVDSNDTEGMALLNR